ncbi:alkaline phosphatase D family protein [Marinomonas ostreistagni]|uniref:alkaline phosphatase D family protein n=1 Tax=Marinomonas ostreistagni TaxID=359209 RepID=UPI00195161C9|nr:alkaline phosphatase D family protein [Marinomonas ostreistagni]MBM6551443.1 alkaline phosphatase family protein [Marinomonas ostreistagni]
MSHDMHAQPIADILAGPILRQVEAQALHLWCATSRPLNLTVEVNDAGSVLPGNNQYQCLKLGERLYIHLLSVQFKAPLAQEKTLSYQLHIMDPDHQTSSVWQAPKMAYQTQSNGIDFIWRPTIQSLLHGSCRKAHHGFKDFDPAAPVGDGLVEADQHLANTPIEQWPSLLMLSGDQIYADDVAGPMLHAIRQCVALLGIPEAAIPDTGEQLSETPYYYCREQLLPHTETSDDVKQQFFKGKKKPVFTTDTAHNHLISLAEVVCMYLLVWSPTLWRHLDLSCPASITDETQKARYEQERLAIEEFIKGLPNVQRVLAHIPTAMMFDDHDVTDDWNLTAEWEQTAYETPLSKCIIGNALFGYFLCQGWGNNPKQFDQPLLERAQRAITHNGEAAYDDFIEELFAYDQWHYQWQTNPKLVVLDTRTHRWRSEQDFGSPSGLMDWEAITDLQHEIRDLDAVILVSPAPMFGVKLIESIQKVFTWFGKPLMVDAENWMAHPGSAYALLNLFTHPKTPTNFTILSGDVHYSFSYDVKLRGIKSSPTIWQITSSGLRNAFPDTLLEWFDRLNRWLYAPWSPLNIFTKRRALRIAPRKPEHASKGERLLNHSGIGYVTFNSEGQPEEIAQLCNHHQKVRFLKDKKER